VPIGPPTSDGAIGGSFLGDVAAFAAVIFVSLVAIECAMERLVVILEEEAEALAAEAAASAVGSLENVIINAGVFTGRVIQAGARIVCSIIC
jgi:hypothetical protein